jgi:hypothetical protein
MTLKTLSFQQFSLSIGTVPLVVEVTWFAGSNDPVLHLA